MACKPLFIFGLARSGTNLLARMLDRHPDVTVALDPYLPLFRSLRNALVASRAAKEVRQRFSSSAPFQDYYFDPDGAALLDLMLAGEANLPLDQDELKVLRLKAGERASLESPTLGAQMSGLAGEDYGQLFRSGLDLVAGLKTGVRWAGCKEVWVMEFVPLLARLFPEARFFALERDPRAIVASLLAMAEKDPTQAAHAPSYLRHWRKQVALTHRFATDPLLAGRFRSVSFEQLATHPEHEARQLCDALNIDFHPEMLRLSADGWRGNSSFDHGGKDVYAETVDRWRKVLPTRVVQAADYLCGPDMALTPYRPTTSPKADEVLTYLEEAGIEAGSWRSDSGDLLVAFGGEMVRRMLLDTGCEPEESLVRRCFLFKDILGSLRQYAA
ncbi:hypothetical protein PROAA_320061 [Candidatus Propionivibrio aalborgensis]|uniref:Sulfotransferase n=2 Tax=Candidatus Propionivibrio aalborgensis TaxID=1860101 RepID=A0A1A8XWQ4_9RHOO|nr:hypothetical protein PROAA_320061 [Candidatus Propionivibrio aalborgensis]